MAELGKGSKSPNLADLPTLDIDPDELQALDVGQPLDVDPSELQSLDIDPSELVVPQPPDTVAGAQPSSPPAQPGGGERNRLEEFLSGAKLGAESVTAPSTITKEELTQERTGFELAGELVGSIGADMAATFAAGKTGAAAGALVGGPVGATIGGLAGMAGWAVYSGVGQEQLAEKRTGEFSPLRASARVALSLNPLLRYGGRVSQTAMKLAPKLGKVLEATEKTAPRLARYAAQVVGETAVAGSEFGMEGAQFAALASIGLHGLAFKNGRSLDPTFSQLAGDLSASPEGIDAFTKATKRLEQMNQPFSMDLVDDDFASFINRSQGATLGGHKPKGKGIAAAKRVLGTMDEEAQEGIWQDYALTKLMGQELADAKRGLEQKVAKAGSFQGELDDLEGFKRHWLDGQNAAQEMDRVAGTGATEVLNNISEARGMYENIGAELFRKAAKAQKAQKKARISNKQMGQLRAYLSEGRQPQHRKGIEHLLDESGELLDGKVKVAVSEWNRTFNEGYKVLRSMGFDPGYVDVYMPRTMVKPEQRAYLIQDMVENLDRLSENMPSKLSRWQADDLMSKGLSKNQADEVLAQIKELRFQAKKLTGSSKGMTLGDAQNLHMEALKSKNTFRMGNDVSAVFSKGDEITDQFRNFDIMESFMSYVHGSVKSAVMNKAMRRAYGQLDAYKYANMPKTAQWWENLLRDLSGDTRGEWRQSWLDMQNRLKYKIHRGLEKEGNSTVSKMGYQAAKGVTELATLWQTAMYPAYLGLNAKSTIRNLGQNWVQTAPYLGGAYGYNVVARASGNPWKHYDRMQQMGLIAKGFKAEQVSAEATKLQRSFGKWGDRAMALYTWSDRANRMLAFNAGHVLAKDLAGGHEDAIKALAKMGPGVKTSLRARGLDSLSAFQNNTDELGDVLGKHMVARTQFHYGPEQKAEFLRSMGPFFSMFTKWPTAVGSDVYATLKDNPKVHQKLMRMTERYLAPLSAAMVIHNAVGEDNELYNYLVGDVKSWAPIMSVLDMTLTANPVVETILETPELTKEILEGDPDLMEARLKKAIRKLMKSSVPVVSSGLNEADRWHKAYTGDALTKKLIED